MFERKRILNLKVEAAWALTNIASGTADQTQVIVEKGGIPWLIKLLSSNNSELELQVLVMNEAS